MVGLYVAKKSEGCVVKPQVLDLHSEYFSVGIELVGTDTGTTIGQAPGRVICRENNKFGLYLHDGAYAYIVGVADDSSQNSFSFNDINGILAENSTGLVRFTKMNHNDYVGAEVYSSGIDFGNSYDYGFNYFGESYGSPYCLLAYNCQVSALYNYWGTTDEQYIKDHVNENVDWKPYLSDLPYDPKRGVKSLQTPTSLTLESSYPNPFNLQAKIDYAIPAATHISLKIYNILGQEINELINQEVQPGYYSIIWNGTDRFGSPVSSGVYLYSLKTPDKVITKKMVMLK